MLTYSNDIHERGKILADSMRARQELDRFLDEGLKNAIIHENPALPEEMQQMAAVSEAIRQVGELRKMKGIIMCDEDEAILSSDLGEGFRPAFLTEKNIRFLPKERRLAMAKSLLKIMKRLSDKEIYPGVINLDALVYDESGSSDEIFLSRVSRFQLGKLRQTWNETIDEDYVEDNLALSAAYPFFDRTCQNVATARLINRLIRDSRLTEELNDDDDHSPENLSELLEDMEEELLHPVTVRTGVWIVYPDLYQSGDPQRLVQQTALVNNLLRSCAQGTEDRPLSVNYIWCGRNRDMRGGSGGVCSTGMKRFDGTFLPYLEWSAEPSEDDSHLMMAYVAAEYEMLHSDFDRKLLLILAPYQKDHDSTYILNTCGNSDGRNAFALLYNSQCMWNGVCSGVNLFNTDDETALRILHDRIASLVAADV